MRFDYSSYECLHKIGSECCMPLEPSESFNPITSIRQLEKKRALAL